MDLDFSVDGEFRVKMTDCLKMIVSDFPGTIQGRVTTTSSYHPFTVREDA